jgi:hypothetical protein
VIKSSRKKIFFSSKKIFYNIVHHSALWRPYSIGFFLGTLKKSNRFFYGFDQNKIVSKNLTSPFATRLKHSLCSQEICIKQTYFLEKFQRSNQKTCMTQRPAVLEKEWIQKGDFLCESVNSFLGELALGKNVLIAYMPWQGYNFEDAILLSEDLVTNHTYTTLHIEKFSIKARDTQQGYEQISIPWFLKTLEQNKKTAAALNIIGAQRKKKQQKKQLRCRKLYILIPF